MPDSSNLLSRLLAHMQPTVFLGSAALVVGFVIFGTLWPETAQSAFGAVQHWIITHFGWLYIFGATGLLVFVLGLLVSPYRHIRLGGDKAEPEFGYLAWFAMLFSAGMGAGLVFWGVAEPLTADPLEPAAGVGQSTGVQVTLIALITAVATLSVVSGVQLVTAWGLLRALRADETARGIPKTVRAARGVM